MDSTETKALIFGLAIVIGLFSIWALFIHGEQTAGHDRQMRFVTEVKACGHDSNCVHRLETLRQCDTFYETQAALACLREANR